ncbi:MAG: TetR/AcrR family transcriptional regulator [Actinobacteria bacterium]|nr:TetR/AcrR family transcriptional regulator [Actinomycetota bacterium]
MSPSPSLESMSPRERILERAIEVIEQGGEVAIRTNTIAEECGVTAPILYRAFTNREGLVVAAQAERYRRSTAVAVEFLVSYIENSSSREELRENISRSLDFIFSAERSEARRLRAEVIGSAVSRPKLRAAVAATDLGYADKVSSAYTKAIEARWIDSSVDVRGVALWAQGVINARVNIEFNDDPNVAEAWNTLTKTAILGALFGSVAR